MKKMRILSYQLSQKLTDVDLQEVSGAGVCYVITGSVSHNGMWDGHLDASIDF